MSFGQEIMQGMRVGTQTAVRTLFEQFEGGSEFVKVLEAKGSCSSLCFMFGICLITFSKAWLTGMEVGVCYDTFLYT